MGLFKSIDSASLRDAEPERAMPKFTTIEYSMDTLVSKLESVDGFSDKEIQEIIYRQYNTILDYDLFLRDKGRTVMQELFQNERFLKNLIICVQNMQLNGHQTICCNKLAYDYIIYASRQPVTEKFTRISKLLLELSAKVNSKTVLILSAIIDITSAKNIAMVRKSSFKEELNVQRLNNLLIESEAELSQQTLLDIYSKLFTRVTTLFTETMFQEPPSGNEKRMKIYNNITMVMVYILDSMTSDNIAEVLKNYSVSYHMRGNPPVRFSFWELHESYSRIMNVFHQVVAEGFNMP